MSDLTSNPGRLRELADKPGLYVIASTAREVAAALRAYADLLERPQEASGSLEVALNQGPRLAEGVGSNPDVSGHDRQPHEPGAVLCVPCLHCSRHVPVDWPACGHCGEHRQPVTKADRP